MKKKPQGAIATRNAVEAFVTALRTGRLGGSPYQTLGTEVAGLSAEVMELEERARVLTNALRSIMHLGSRMQRRGDTENAKHILRICASAGITPSILRKR